ncbi:MAG: hypothetical protein ACREYF_13760 [Gammaproteobacteria bacterium]
MVVVFGLLFNPATFPKILSSFTPELALPPWYTSVFWGVTSLLFIAATVVAVRAKPRQKEERAPVFSKRSAIKGLRSYAFEDAELFARLQRERELRECLEAITHREFRFGIVFGESGCGKSSFIQAGLWPRLAEQKPPHRAVYVKLTDQDPLDSIRQALTEQALLPQEKVENNVDEMGTTTRPRYGDAGIGAKARALSTVASQMAEIANVRNDSALWSSALQVVDDISEPMHQGRTLAEIGENAAGHYYMGLFTSGLWTHVADRKQVDTLFARAYEIADAITDPKVKASARKAIGKAKVEEIETKGIC